MTDKIPSMHPYFDIVEMTPGDYPAFCSAVIPNARALETWENFPAAALPQKGRFASGRGLTREQSLASGIGEAVELASCCSWGNEDVTIARQQDLESGVVGPAELLGFSESQLRERDKWNRQLEGLDWLPFECPADREIAWVFASDGLSGERVAVPADSVYIGRREPGDTDAVAIADSNGCASGTSDVSAKIRALLELIERDATGRWWYGHRRRPTLSPDVLDDHPALLNALVSRERHFFLFDITSDLGVPCVAAISSGKDDRGVAVGFAANMEVHSAALSAVLEMLQIELSLRAMAAAEEPQELWQAWLKNVSTALPLFNTSEKVQALPRCDPQAPEKVLDVLLARCRDNECRVLFADLTRPEFQAPTWRAISPDLCHYKPRFGRLRLLATDSRDLDNSEGQHALPNEILLSI